MFFNPTNICSILQHQFHQDKYELTITTDKVATFGGTGAGKSGTGQ
jgi:hypothetical protein